MPVNIKRPIHFCQSQGGTVPGESIRGIGCRLVSLLFLERGVLRTPLKEVLECFVQVSEGLLNGYRGDICKPGMYFLEVRQHCGEIIVVELLTKSIGRLAGIKPPIVHETAASERLRKNMLLFVSRIEPILVCPLRSAHYLFALREDR